MKNLIVSSMIMLLCCLFTEALSQDRPQRGPKPDAPKGYQVGDIATDFNLKNIDGKQYSLDGIEGAKGYIVVFTSNVCPFALMYEDRLIKLHNEMAPRGYPVVAINSNDASMQEGDSFDKMKTRAKEKGFPFLYLKDDAQTVYPQFGATRTPHVFLLDKDLKVQYIGAIDDDAQSAENVKEKYVENAINALESGSLPEPNFTKAIGCPIKSKAGIAGKGGRPQGGERRGPPSPEKILEMMDKNDDQKVSLEEAHGPLKNDFDRVDTNKDGYLTKEELAAIKKGGRRPR
ncbi:MAG: redoxin domain-containing protein [Bacteroidia bacterium]